MTAKFTKEIKINTFAYIVKSLEDKFGIDKISTISHLAILKLLFFIATLGSSKVKKIVDLDDLEDDESCDLLDIFDEFCAMPYGPVESDIYNAILNKSIPVYTFTRKGCSSNNNSLPEIEEKIANRVKEAIKRLDLINDKIYNCSPFELVEITHKWSCWKVVYKRARNNYSNSARIPIELIEISSKYYA